MFFLNKKNFSLNASLYFPDKNIPFTRIYEPKNRSEYMAPDNQTSIVVEVPYNVDKLISKNIKEWNATSIDSIKSFLINNDFICDDDILDYEVFDMPHAYPILDTKISPIVSKISSYLDRIKNLSLLGRSAEFKYLHVHDLFSKSEKIVNTIVN